MKMSPKSPTPSILIQNDSGSLHNFPLPLHRRPSFPHPTGMAIPRARDEGPPPPLPPPRHIGEELSRGHDIGWQFGNTGGPGSRPFQLASIKPGSSLLLGQGHLHNSGPHDRGLGSRKPSLPSSIEDMSLSEPSEDEHSVKTRPSLSSYRFSSERQLGQKALETSSHAYDKQLLSKIGGPNTPTRTTAPQLPSSAQDSASASHTSFSKLNGQLKPLSVPERLQTSLDSPVSRFAPYSGFRSPIFDSAESHQRRFSTFSTPSTLDDTASQHRGSYDHSIFSESEFGMEETGMRELHIHDRSPSISEEYQTGPKGGLKRRASSPPRKLRVRIVPLAVVVVVVVARRTCTTVAPPRDWAAATRRRHVCR